jgi:RimJ/RimL family protein N-acetyltransferase
MTAPEIVGQTKTKELKTALPDITLRDIDASTLPKLKHLFESNAQFIARGGIVPDAVYEMTEQEVLGQNPNLHRRLGIWKDDQLVGYAGIVPSETPRSEKEVEVSYVVDPTYSRQGIARAAVEAITETENDKGNSVIAEVEQSNHASIRLLGKLGFEQSGHSDGRNVYVHKEMTEQEMMRRLGF